MNKEATNDPAKPAGTPDRGFRPTGAPPLYSQDGQGYGAIVHAHYFVASADWLVTEYDPDEDLAFGWACLGDRQLAELGYVSLEELESIRVPVHVVLNGQEGGSYGAPVERDLHWPEGLTLTQAIAYLDEVSGRG